MARKQLLPSSNEWDRVRERDTGIRRSDLYFSRTSGVPEAEYVALMIGFRKMISETGVRISTRDFGNFQTGNGEYSSPDWYQAKAMTRKERGFGPQVSAMVLDELLRDEPFQKTTPHYDVLVVDRDMTTQEGDANNNFIFGYGPYPNNIISIRRFMQWIRDPIMRQKCLSILGAHEFGHNLDLVNRNFNRGTEGYKIGHCNGERGPCLMEQVNVPGARTIEDQTRLLMQQADWLCQDCAEELAQRKRHYEGIGIDL